MAWNIGIAEQDDLIIYDSAQRRISIFEFTGNDLQVRRDVNLDPFPVNFHLMRDGSLVLHTLVPDQENDRIILVNLNGTIKHENLIEFERNEQMMISDPEGERLMSTSSPHHARNIVRFHGDKMIYSCSSEMGYSVYDLNSGEIINQISLKRPDYPLPIEERQEFVDDLIERTGLGQGTTSDLVSEMPDTKGKVRSMHYDPDGYVWLNIIDDLGPDWLIFTASDDLIGSFNENFEGNIIRIQNGKIFVRTDNGDGVPMLKVFRYNVDQSTL